MFLKGSGRDVPKLVDTGQDGDGPVPDVAGVVHLSVLHLHLGIFQPESDVPVVHIQSALVYRTSPGGREGDVQVWLQVQHL